ncbi:hypothetical protein E4K10_44885 [Streptomyces sp. T1317-0309]|nr:hypothetical protein E4K10_44885 [Streptomyces sp. T1317-0309]
MKNLVWHIAAAAASAVVAGGALFAAGGTASAAAIRTDGHTLTRAAVTVEAKADASDHGRNDQRGEWGGCRNDDRQSQYSASYGSLRWNADDRVADDCFYPWVYDQLVLFGLRDDHGHQRIAEG